MTDSRLNQVIALLDDARSLLVDIVDEGGGSDRDRNQIDAARQFINHAVVYVKAAGSEVAP